MSPPQRAAVARRLPITPASSANIAASTSLNRRRKRPQRSPQKARAGLPGRQRIASGLHANGRVASMGQSMRSGVWPEMAAQIICQLDNEMVAVLQDRLTKMDEAIDLMQGLRRETAALVTELFPEAA